MINLLTILTGQRELSRGFRRVQKLFTYGGEDVMPGYVNYWYVEIKSGAALRKRCRSIKYCKGFLCC